MKIHFYFNFFKKIEHRSLFTDSFISFFFLFQFFMFLFNPQIVI